MHLVVSIITFSTFLFTVRTLLLVHSFFRFVLFIFFFQTSIYVHLDQIISTECAVSCKGVLWRFCSFVTQIGDRRQEVTELKNKATLCSETRDTQGRNQRTNPGTGTTKEPLSVLCAPNWVKGNDNNGDDGLCVIS